LARILKNNINFLGNLAALKQWYKIVRQLFFSGAFGSALHSGLCWQCDAAIDERLKQMDILSQKASQYLEDCAGDDSAASAGGSKIRAFVNAWPGARQAIRDCVNSLPEDASGQSFLQAVEKAISEKGQNYLAVISGLGQNEADMGSNWLYGVAKAVEEKALLHLNFLQRIVQ
ncbi:MAG: hypothetical protein QMD09_07105, partial [Desulfatibacillaceae bacterium]|nr:hypothetical protein [Desulfatibacillaceae bacterium]